MRVIRIHGTLSLLRSCFKKLKYKKLKMSELGQLLPGYGPIKLKLSAGHQDMGENVLQYMFLKRNIFSKVAPIH